MIRRFPVGLLLLIVCLPSVRADAFDRYVNPVLNKAPGSPGVKEITRLTLANLTEYDRVLPNLTGVFLIVKTNEHRNAKLLVQAARQRVGHQTVPVLLIDRFRTYKEGEDRAVQSDGKSIQLYDGFHFNLDVGQVVPAELGGDLRLIARGRTMNVEAVGKAKMYLVTRPLPGLDKPGAGKPVVGDVFEPRFFNGTYKLHDDGRRTGELTLKVGDDGGVTGAYYSNKDGQKYDVVGRVGNPKHAIQFTIKFPRTEQVFQGWMFTGDAGAITGSARMLERETGFYAVRTEGAGP